MLFRTDCSGNSKLAVDSPCAPVHDGAAKSLNPRPLVISVGLVRLNYLDWDSVTNCKLITTNLRVMLERKLTKNCLRVPKPGGEDDVSLEQRTDGCAAALLALVDEVAVTFDESLGEGGHWVSRVGGAVDEHLVKVSSGESCRVCPGVAVKHGVVGDVLLAVNLGL